MFDNLISVTQVSIFDVLNDERFKAGLELYGWSTQPDSRANKINYYNGSGNCALEIMQEANATYIKIGVSSLVQQDGDLLAGYRQFSSLKDAVDYSLINMERFAGFNPFASNNRF